MKISFGFDFFAAENKQKIKIRHFSSQRNSVDLAFCKRANSLSRHNFLRNMCNIILKIICKIISFNSLSRRCGDGRESNVS